MRITKQPLDFTHIMHTSTNDEAAEIDLPRVQHLHCRNGVFYLRRKVPVALQAVIGAKQVWRSLGTSDPACAIQRLHTELQELEAEFNRALRSRSLARMRQEQVRVRGDTATKYLLEAHISPLVDRFKHAHLLTDDVERQGLDSAERGARAEELECARDELLRLAATEDHSEHEALARDILRLERLIPPPRSDLVQRLAVELLRADIEVCEVQLERLRGRGIPTAVNAPCAPRLMPTMLDVFHAWSPGQDNRRTIDAYRGFVAEFEHVAGALPCVAIRREHVNSLVEQLASRGCQRDTVKNYIGGLGTLLNFSIGEGLVSSTTGNPFASASLASLKERPASLDRRSYESGELSMLFNSPVYTERRRMRGQVSEAAYWAPPVMLFSGGRAEEVAQLRTDDVVRINGVWAIRFGQLHLRQRLKNLGSWRFVPIHEELIKCGFLAYAAATKQAGHDWLFPSLKDDNKYGVRSAALSKWFSRYLDRIGLVDDRLCLYSLRFAMKQQCSRCGIETEVRDALTGHWLGERSASRGYMRAAERQYPFPVLVEAMKKLRYDELDLSHLHVRDSFEGVDEAFGQGSAPALPQPVRRPRAAARPRASDSQANAGGA